MAPEKPKLLIVDDETDICTITQSYFGKRGFIVSTTGNGLEALTMIKVARPDIVLLDVTLGDGMSGVEVLKKLREHDKDTKVIVISGNTDATVIDTLYDLGIAGFYAKPMVLTDIAKKVYEKLGIEYNKDVERQAVENTVPISDTQISGSVHQLTNKLNIIRGDCEEFLLDFDEGFFINKTNDELLKITVEIIRRVGQNIESFIANYEQGFLKRQTSDQLLKMNVQTLKNIVQAVDDTMGIINQKELKESKEKEMR